MKKFLLLLLTYVFTSGAFAQSILYRLSFVAGPDISWMKSDQHLITNEGDKTGYTFGLNADFFFSQSLRYAFTTGLLINSQGGELRYNTNNSFYFNGVTLQPGTKIKYNLKYLEIPTAIKLRTAQFYRNTYFGVFGLTNRINIGANGTSSDGKFQNDGINNEVSLFNTALNVGGGLEFDLGKKNSLSVGLYYNESLIDVTSNKSIDDQTNLNSIRLQIGIIF